MGPVITAQSRDRILDYIERGVTASATVVVDGRDREQRARAHQTRQLLVARRSQPMHAHADAQPIDLRAEQLQGRWRSEPLTSALASGRFSELIIAYNLFPADAEQTIAQNFSMTETLSSPDGLTFQVLRYHP